MSEPTPPLTSDTDPVIAIVGNMVGVRGYIPGFCQPALRVNIAVQSRPAEGRVVQIAQALKAAFPLAATDAGVKGEDELVHLVMHWIVEMQRAAEFPIFEPGKILNTAPGDVSRYALAIPVFDGSHKAVGRALGWLTGFISTLWAGRDGNGHLKALDKVMKSLKRCLPQAPNTLRLLSAAHAVGIPASQFAGSVFQFGQGARARLMDSSFTQATPSISAYVARNKLLTARVLRRAGVPVPKHAAAATLTEAEQVANSLGYPVVVKPVDLDGGAGVWAGIQSGQELRQAFEAAQKHGREILVEKHCEGRDYRLLMFQGTLLRAVERVPAGITGDGVRSVRTLMEEVNRDPRRGTAPNAVLKCLVLDKEALDLLRASGLTPESIPTVGTFVRFRRIANISLGGVPVLVNDVVHPDNILLARRIAALLRLDLAGIDLLMPDIARPWWEGGAAICEVNAQPNLGRLHAGTLYEDLLRQIVPGDGRIPIGVVVGEPSDAAAAAMARALCTAGMNAGWAGKDGVWVGTERIAGPIASAFAGGQMLMMDTTVEAAILSIHDAHIMDGGLPFDRFDALIVAGDDTGLVKHLLPACRGPVLFAADEPWAPALRNSLPSDCMREVATRADLAAASCAVLKR